MTANENMFGISPLGSSVVHTLSTTHTLPAAKKHTYARLCLLTLLDAFFYVLSLPSSPHWLLSLCVMICISCFFFMPD